MLWLKFDQSIGAARSGGVRYFPTLPTLKRRKKMVRSITINPVLNGWVCQVGCQTVVFTDLIKMTAEIGNYYRNPEALEKIYIENAVNKPMNNVPEPYNQPQGYSPAKAQCETPLPQRDRF
jgi:hypothetical protein